MKFFDHSHYISEQVSMMLKWIDKPTELSFIRKGQKVRPLRWFCVSHRYTDAQSARSTFQIAHHGWAQRFGTGVDRLGQERTCNLRRSTTTTWQLSEETGRHTTRHLSRFICYRRHDACKHDPASAPSTPNKRKETACTMSTSSTANSSWKGRCFFFFFGQRCQLVIAGVPLQLLPPRKQPVNAQWLNASPPATSHAFLGKMCSSYQDDDETEEDRRCWESFGAAG